MSAGPSDRSSIPDIFSVLTWHIGGNAESFDPFAWRIHPDYRETIPSYVLHRRINS